ncbi:MAG TPA: flagellar biosynthesis anti-sigma factor FlgM [Sphingomonas sp.]|nr:flagellar biosynthesis anti-sigma factor FlgM [Sphingomonas sp.]
MINGIGLSTGGSLASVGGHSAAQRGEAAQRTSNLTASPEDRAAVSTTVSQIAGQGAPVAVDRVAALKAAIRSGQYRADPTAIAGGMINSDLGASL